MIKPQIKSQTKSMPRHIADHKNVQAQNHINKEKSKTTFANKTARPLFTSFCIGLASSVLAASLLVAPCGVVDAKAAVADLTTEGDVLVNYKEITETTVVNSQNVGMGTIEVGKDLRNEGTISLKGQTKTTYGMYDYQSSADSIEDIVTNKGDITVETTDNFQSAYGVFAATSAQATDTLTVNNGNNITVTSMGTYAASYGISANTSAQYGDVVSVANSGNITVTSQKGAAYGISAMENSHDSTTGTATVLNNGEIRVTGALPSYGIQVRASTGTEKGEENAITVTNNKLIQVSSIIDSDSSSYGGMAYGIDANGYGQHTTVLVTNTGTIDIEGSNLAYGIQALAHSSYSGTATVNNSGEITAKSDGKATGIYFGYNINNMANATNTGSIKVTGGDYAFGIESTLFANITNDGLIQVTTTTADGTQGTDKRTANNDPMNIQGRAYGGARGITSLGSALLLTNNDIITVTGPDDAYGVSTSGSYKKIVNTNTINVTSQNEAYGVYFLGHENTVQNSGDITIDTINSGAGVYIYGSSNVDTINDGTISVTSPSTSNTGQCFYGIYANTTSMSTRTTEEEDAANIFFNAKSDIENNGTINLTSNGIESYGIFAQTTSRSPIATRNNISNSGDINITNTGDNAVGVLLRSSLVQSSNHHYGSFIVPLDTSVNNTGNINVTSANGEAYGIQHSIDYSADLDNKPSYHFTDLLYADTLTNTISNTKSIEAHGETDTYGIYSSISSGSHIDSYFRRNAGTEKVTQYTQEFNNIIINESDSSIIATSKNGKAYGIFAVLNSYADTKATGSKQKDYGAGYSVDVDYTIDYHYTDTINQTVSNAGIITVSSDGIDGNTSGYYNPNSDNICGIHSEVNSIFSHKKVIDFTDEEKAAFIDASNNLPGSSTNEALYGKADLNEDYIPDIYSNVTNMGTINLISNAGDVCGMYGAVTTSSDTEGVHQHISHIVTNDGIINAKTKSGNACGMYSALTTSDNEHSHTANSEIDHHFSDGIYANKIINNGILNVTSENGEAYGMYVELSNANVEINNYGDLHVKGKTATHDVFVHGRGDKTTTATIGTWHITLRDYDKDHNTDVFACSGTGTIDFSRACFIVTPGTKEEGFAFNTEYAVQDMVSMTRTTGGTGSGGQQEAGQLQTAAIGRAMAAQSTIPFLTIEVLHGDVNGIPIDEAKPDTPDEDIEQTLIIRTTADPETSPGHEAEEQITTTAAQNMHILSAILGSQLDYDELPESWRAFAIPYYTHSVNYDYGYDTDIMGLALGATRRVNDAFSAGAHLNFATIDSESGSTETDALMAGIGLHAKYHFTDDFHIRGQVTGFIMESDLHLSMDAQPERVTSNADTSTLGMYAALFAAYDYHANENHTFTPELALKYIYTETDGFGSAWYKESGLPTDHDIRYGDVDFSELYAEASLRWKGNIDLGTMENGEDRGILHPTMRAGLRHALMGAEVESNLHYQGFDLGTTTSHANETSALFEAGLEWVKGDTTTSLSYIADFGNKEESHMGLLKIEFEF